MNNNNIGFLNNNHKEINQEYNKLLDQFFVFSMEDKEPIPKFTEVHGKEYVYYGEDNDYPNFLIEMKNSSPMHGAIIMGLADQVAGSGIRIKGNKEDTKLSEYIDNINKKDQSLHDVVKNLSIDYLTFGGFSLSPVWNKGKTTFDLYHTDFSTLRSGKADATGMVDKYYFSNDWNDYNLKVKDYPAFDKKNKTGTQIYYYFPYSPGNVVYPIPEYIAASKWIMLDSKVADFHNSFIDAGFFPSLFINFNNGEPSAERKKEIVDQLKAAYKGAKKAGNVFVNFAPDKDRSAEITVMPISDADRKFTVLSDLILQQILTGWKISSPELVGLKVPGELGRSSILEAAELFYNLVVRAKQKAIESEINYLLKAAGFENEIEIIPLQPIRFRLGETLLQQIMSINSLRELADQPPIENGEMTLYEYRKLIDQKYAIINTGSDTAREEDVTNE